MKKSVIIAFLAFIAMLGAVSCSNGSNLKKEKCTVIFNLKGGSSTLIEERTEVKYGDPVDEPDVRPTAAEDKYYVFDHWSKEGTGSETAYNFSEKVTSDITLNAIYRERYPVGGKGPTNGIIAYRNSSYDPKSTEESRNWKYLEVADTDFSAVIGGSNTTTFAWGNTAVAVSTSTEIGAGRSNTKKMAESDSLDSKVAKAIWNQTWEGRTDWFIPSKDELSAIRTAIGNNTGAAFSNEYYWSSSEKGDDSAWNLGFGNYAAEAEHSCSRSNQNLVRLVRVF